MEDYTQEKAFLESLKFDYRLNEFLGNDTLDLLSKYKAYLIEQGQANLRFPTKYYAIPGATFDDTEFDSESAVYGYNTALDDFKKMNSGLIISDLESENARLRKTLEKVRSMSCNASPEQNRKIRFLITETLNPNSKEE